MIARYSEINKHYWEALERGDLTKPVILVRRFADFFAEYGIDTSVAEAFNVSAFLSSPSLTVTVKTP